MDELLIIKSEPEFKFLFDEYYTSLFYYANRIVKNSEVADDITQEVFISLWDKKSDFKFHSIAGFLYTSVRFKCMNYLRTENKRSQKHVEMSVVDRIQVDDRLCLIEEDMIRQIKKEINSMPEQRRKVFELHVTGYGQQEIADELGISVNTVKTHKLKARQYLKEQLKDSLYILFILYFDNFL